MRRTAISLFSIFLCVSSLWAGLAFAGSVAAEKIEIANAAFESQDWETAADAYQALVEENPYSGHFWYRLGAARYSLKEYSTSAEAYGRAADVGYQVGGSLYNMGCDYALLGETEQAVEAIERAIQNGLRNREQLIRTDSDLDGIRDTELFQTRLFPAVPDDVSRADGWRIDLEYLTRRMEDTHYDVYRNITPAEWNDAIAAISDDIDDLDDHEVIVRLMQLIARVGDGHTGVRTVGGPHGFHAIPVQFYIFKDGVFIRAASPEHADVVGARVVRVGKLPVDEAVARVATVTQRDNPQQIKWIAPRFMSLVEVLDGLDISDGLDHVDIVIEDSNGKEKKVRLEPYKITEDMSHGNRPETVTMRDEATAPVPMWQKDTREHYWFEYLPEERIVYFQFNSVRNKDDGESIQQFSDRLFDFVEANEVDALVIDVRLNHGGNNYLVKPIIHSVIQSDKVNQRGRLFTIIGRETFSACQNFSNRLQRETDVLFVGEPTGSRPNFVGEGNPIELPYSGVRVNGSSRYWQDTRSDDYRIWVAPDLVAEMTSTDFRSNHDPAMTVIREYLDFQRSNVRPASATQ